MSAERLAPSAETRRQRQGQRQGGRAASREPSHEEAPRGGFRMSNFEFGKSEIGNPKSEIAAAGEGED